MVLLIPPPAPSFGLLRRRCFNGVDDRARGLVAVVFVVAAVAVVVEALVASASLRCRRCGCPFPAFFERWCL